jgi:hypothetical protein
MLQNITYKHLLEQTRKELPYRGTHNRFPVGSRKQSNKYFFTEERLSGESIARVIYGERSQYTSISKELHEHLKGKINVNVITRGSPTESVYYRIDTVPNEIGIVREDNTFEFTAHHLNQGENNILTKWSYGYFNTSARHGGVVHSGLRVFHPIWHGARFSMDNDCLPYKPYQVFGLAVKRKEAKDYFKSYEKFFTIARTMSLAMDWENFQSAGIEIVNQHITGFDWEQVGNWYDPDRENNFKAKAHELKDISPFDAYVLYLCAYNTNVIYRFANGVGVKRSYYREIGLNELYLGFHRRVTQDIYRATPELFKEVEYEASKGFPANNWGIKVLVDGKQVKQY